MQLSANVECRERINAFILTLKIHWNQKVAIILRIFFSGAKGCAALYILSIVPEHIFRYVPESIAGAVSTSLLLRIRKICERIRLPESVR